MPKTTKNVKNKPQTGARSRTMKTTKKIPQRRLGQPRFMAGLAAVVVFAAAGMVVTRSQFLHADIINNCGLMTVGAHRGAPVPGYTEETLAAYQRTVNKGSTTIEGDMHLNKDGHWVMMHDDTVDRTTKSTGLVSSKTLTQIRNMKAEDGVHPIPLVNDVINKFAANPAIQFQLEIKSYSATQAQINNLLSIMTTAKVKSRVVLTSYAATPLAKVRANSSTWKTMLNSTLAPTAAKVSTSANYGVAVPIAQITPDWVASQQSQGKKVWAWDVNDQTTTNTALANKLDGVLTDVPQSVQSWCAQAAPITPPAA